MQVNQIRHYYISRKVRPQCKWQDDTFVITKEIINNGYRFKADEDVAFIICKIGEVTEVHVEYEARRCGLARLLTTLCFIDADLNVHLGPEFAMSNIAMERLDESVFYKFKAAFVRQNCERFWHLYPPTDNPLWTEYLTLL